MHTAPFANFGLPYHRSFAADAEPLPPDEPVELAIELMGTGVLVDAGHRLRLTITGALARDFGLFPDPEGRDRPTITVLRDAAHPSRLEVPVVSDAR
jgi:predicted acyl esterase